MLYAMYLRKSRADVDAEARGEGETLARHKAILSALAVRNGHAIAQIYPEVVSGETIADRPSMQQLLADVAAGKWQGVYVMEVERLARGDTMDQGRMAQTFLYSGTKILTPMKIYDPSDESDVEYFEFSLFMSRREYKTINRRIQAGRMQSVKEGRYICSRPAYGYQKVKITNGKGFTLAIIPDEATVVRQVFDWYLHGCNGETMGLTRIANRLMDLHIPPGQQGSTWKPCRIHRMLTNEVYMGMIRWGKVKTERNLTPLGIEKSLHMTNDYQLYEGLHPAIIDHDIYAAVQERLEQGHIPLQLTKQLSNPLSGLVFCSECGHSLRGKPAAGRQGAVLYCATHNCSTVRTYRDPLEHAILQTLRSWLSDFNSGDTQIRPPEKHVETNLLVSALSNVKSELTTLTTQKVKLHDLLEQGVYSIDVFAERMVDLSKRMEKAVENIRLIEEQLLHGKPKQNNLALLAPTIHHVLDTYDTAVSAQSKNKLLRTVISRVEYSKTQKGNQHVDPNQFTLVIHPIIIS